MKHFALADKRLDVIVRQFDCLLGKGRSADEALAILQEYVPDDMQPMAARLSEVVNRATSGITRDPGALGPLSRAMVLAAGAEATPERTLPTMLKLTGEMRDVARIARRSFFPRLVYSAFLAVAGLLLSLFFALFIFPLQDSFLEFAGTPSPHYFQGLIALGWLGHPLIFAAILLLVGIVALLFHRGTSQLASINPDTRALRLLPGFAATTRMAKTMTTLALCKALMRAGATEEWVMEEARKLSATNRHDRTIDALELAAKTGTLAEEFDYQQQANATAIVGIAARCGTSTIVAVRALVLVALAHLVVSFCIPILEFNNLFPGAR